MRRNIRAGRHGTVRRKGFEPILFHSKRYPALLGVNSRFACRVSALRRLRALGLTGAETVTLEGLESLSPRATVTAKITFADGKTKSVDLICRIDTLDELDYFKNCGILHYVLRGLAA